MEDQPTNIFSSSINWLSTKIHRYAFCYAGYGNQSLVPALPQNATSSTSIHSKSKILSSWRWENPTQLLNLTKESTVFLSVFLEINNFYSLQTNTDKPL